MNNKSQKNIDDIPLTDLDYEGVIYEPSNINKNFYTESLGQNSSKNKNEPKKKIKKAPNFNFNLFIFFTIGLAIVVFGLVATLTYSSIASHLNLPTINLPNKNEESILSNQSNNSETNQNSQNDNEFLLDNNTNKNILGIIKDINYETGLFTFSNINTNKVYTLKTKPSSIFKDKYGNILTMSELELGTVVDFSFDDNNKINYVNENANYFKLENVSNTKIDLELKTLEINDKKFKISDSISIVRNNQPYDLLNISPLDIIDISGYNNIIYFINIKKGNGTLKLVNKPKLKNGIIEIDRNIFKSIDSVENINLSEGTHKVVIRSDDTISFVKEIEITSGNETVLDLNQLINKSGDLFIKTNVKDYTLYINNRIEASRDSLYLPYGSYDIKVEKEGYKPFETNVMLNSPQYTLDIKLEKLEKPEEKEKKKMGKIYIASTPENAQVFINNNLVGTTPLKYTLPQGVHTVTLKKEGYSDFVLSSITVGDEESSFNITMHKAKNDNDNTDNLGNSEETTQSIEDNENIPSEPTI